jgi:hypothetical protein
MNQSQNQNSNPLGELWNSISNWGGNQDTMQPTQFQQKPMQAGPQSYLANESLAPMQNTMANSNPPFNPTFWDKMFGYQKGDVQYGAMAPGLLQGAGSIAQSILGWGQLGEAKRQNAFTQDNWQKQYDNQTTLTNASQRDRQSARVAAAPGAYQSVGEYMQQNKVG